jgi:6-phosphofructokinase 1
MSLKGKHRSSLARALLLVLLFLLLLLNSLGALLDVNEFFTILFMHCSASLAPIRVHEICNLNAQFMSADIPNTEVIGSENGTKFNKIVDDDIVLADIVRNLHNLRSVEAYPRAGARSVCHFDPKKVKAAIVTCGGLCPGLNNVIRELVHTLIYTYGCNNVIGIRGGYNGMTDPAYEPLPLTVEVVDTCHHLGGSILGSSRGGFDGDKIIEFLLKHGINQLYVIGGDGTHRGALAISEDVIARNLNISVTGIPKTIDNDVDIIDRSFGFQTAVEAAQLAIESAKTEAKCNLPNGIGIVKLMGRSAGFIASHATLSSGDVDLCLIPEIPLELYGERGFLPFLEQRVKENGHAVVVVAEGAGEDVLSESKETDAGGNRKLPPIGEFLKHEICQYFKSKNIISTVKYIDPSYMIRYIVLLCVIKLYISVCIVFMINSFIACEYLDLFRRTRPTLCTACSWAKMQCTQQWQATLASLSAF